MCGGKKRECPPVVEEATEWGANEREEEDEARRGAIYGCVDKAGVIFEEEEEEVVESRFLLEKVDENKEKEFWEETKELWEVNEKIGKYGEVKQEESLPWKGDDRYVGYRKPFPLAPAIKDEVQRVVLEWEEHGLIERSREYETNLPVVVVVTKNQDKSIKKVRICVDCRQVNMLLEDRNDAIPRITDFKEKLAGKKFFSMLDLSNAFLQLPLKQEDRKSLAFTILGVKYRSTRTVFGLKHIANRFQMIMEGLFGHLPVIVYIDNLLVATESWEEHMEIVKEVVGILNREGWKLNKEKTEAARTTIRALGLVYDGDTVSVDQNKVKALLEMEVVPHRKVVRAFIGGVNFIATFVPRIHVVLHALQLMAADTKKRLIREEVDEQVAKVKECIKETKVVSQYQDGFPLQLFVDASGDGVGAVLIQEEVQSGRRWFLGMFSRAFRETEKRWPITDREFEAIVRAISYFQYILIGRTFTIYTDHLANVFSTSETGKARLFRRQCFLSYFNFTIQYIKGTDNIAADHLSRIAKVCAIAS